MSRAPTPPPPTRSESFADLFEASKTTPTRRTFSSGNELDVRVVQIGRDAVFVELDGKQEGYIESKELLSESGEVSVKVGSLVRARVIDVGGRPGAVRLTPIAIRQVDPEADESASRPVVLAQPGSALAAGGHVRGKVALVERFGVFLQLELSAAQSAQYGKRGVRGLIPTSELGLPRGADAHRHFPVGTELEAKIIEIDERGRVRLSVAQLAADVERHHFQEFESQSKKGTADAPVRLGTLGELLAQRSSGATKGGNGPSKRRR